MRPKDTRRLLRAAIRCQGGDFHSLVSVTNDRVGRNALSMPPSARECEICRIESVEGLPLEENLLILPTTVNATKQANADRAIAAEHAVPAEYEIAIRDDAFPIAVLESH